MKILFHHVFFVGLLLGYLGIFTLGFWWLYPYKVVEFKKSPLPVVKKELRVGDHIPIEFDFCKYMNYPAHVLVNIEDHVFYEMAPYDVDSQIGCYDRISSSLIVPDALHPGDRIRVHFTLIYTVNPVRERVYTLYSEKFTIIK